MSTSNHRDKNTAAGAIGNVLEWYDFALFGFLAPIMSPHFFPGSDPLAGLIKTYGVFAAGYLMRPLGGMIFGYIGDRVGRVKALRLSIGMMAIPTVLVGTLPTHEQVGAWAAALLILLRLIQGISVGGELVGSMTYLVESAERKRRGLTGSWSLFGASFGILLGSVVVTILTGQLSSDAMSQWGWRAAFFSGGLLFILGIWLRSDMDDSPTTPDTERPTQNPLMEVITQIPGRVIQLSLVLLIFAAGFYTLFIWMPTYLGRILPNPITHADDINNVATVVLILSIPFFGWLSDRVGFRTVVMSGMVLFIIAIVPMFAWVDHGQFSHALIALVLMACIFAAIQGPMPALLVESVPPHLRASAIGIAYNLTLGIFGGTAPMVCTYLIDKTNNLASPGWYLLTLAVISLIVTMTLNKNSQPSDVR